MSKANRHTGDINFDYKFDCQHNCPYCNDYVIHIQLLSMDLSDDFLSSDYRVDKKYICHRCGNDFYEVYLFDEESYGDWFIEEFELYLELGNIEDMPEYQYTMLGEGTSGLQQKYKYPAYRWQMPEQVDIFEPGPIEDRSEILDLGDKSNSFGFLYFPRQ